MQEDENPEQAPEDEPRLSEDGPRMFQIVKIYPLHSEKPVEIEARGIEVNDGLLWLRVSDTITRGFIIQNIHEILVVRVQDAVS